MGLFGTLGKAVGVGGFKKTGGAMGLPGMGPQRGAGLGGVRSMDPAAKDRMRAALTAGRNDGSIKGPMGMLKFMVGYRDTPPPTAGPAGAPPPPTAGASSQPGMEAMAQGAGQLAQMTGLGPKVMGAAAGMPSPWGAPAGPSPLQAGIQQMIGPQEPDPYEAWKAGGRQGDRPAGY